MRSWPIPISFWCCKVTRREPFASVFREIAEQQLELAGCRQPVPQSWSVVIFPLDTNSNSLPFLQFQADGHCRVQWAELA